MDRSDAQLNSAFHRAILLTVCLSSLILGSAEGHMMPCALTPLIAVPAWLLVDRNRVVRLPAWLANCLGTLALITAAAEFSKTGLEAKLLAGSHLIVYLTWIVLWLQKDARQYWWILALSLLQIAIAAVLTSSAAFGASLTGMLILLLWTLSVFSLQRLQAGVQHNPAESDDIVMSKPATDLSNIISVQNGIQRDADEPWINWRFRGLVTLSFMTSLLLAMVVFAAFPRVWVSASPFGSMSNTGERRRSVISQSGFTETVALDSIGTMLQTEGRVLIFRVTDVQSGKEVDAATLAAALCTDEVRFRGNAMGFYQKGEWLQSMRGSRGRGLDRLSAYSRPKPRFKVHITQAPPTGPYAFAPYPISEFAVETHSDSETIRQRFSTSSLIWVTNESDFDTPSTESPRNFSVLVPAIPDPNDLNYTLWPIADEADTMTRSKLHQLFRSQAENSHLPSDLSTSLPKLYQLSRELCGAPGQLVPPKERISRIMNYLTAENRFTYSVTISRKDESLDPIEDFLFNTRRGHCQYFASACTLMLQSVGIPARIVNGFYGCEKNTVSGRYEIRQRHAHAWTEAFVDSHWITLEPTLSARDEDSTANTQAVGFLGDLQTAVSDFWTDGIHSMTLQKQQSMLDPVITAVADARKNLREKGLMAAIRVLFSDLSIGFRQWFGWKMLVSLLIILSAVGTVAWRKRWFQRPLHLLQLLGRKLGISDASSGSVVRFYAGFCTLCEKHGLRLNTADTAMENAEKAISFFSDKLTTASLQQLPVRVAQAFNEVRFGQIRLTDEQLQHIRDELDAFADALQSAALTPAPAKGSLRTHAEIRNPA